MKIKLLLIYLLFVLSNIQVMYSQKRTNFIIIKSNGKILPISKIAKIGKISVFIIGSSWCAPCKGLKKRIEDTIFSSKKYDFYYTELATELKKYSQTNSYKFWTKIEGLDSFPLIYITSQSSNILAKFTLKDSDDLYKRIIETIKDINIETKKFSIKDVYLIKDKIKISERIKDSIK